MLTLSRVSAVLIVSALLVGCGSGEEEPAFMYGEKDMQDAVLGDWQGDLTLDGQAPTKYTLSITQALPGTSPACSSRTFNGPLCIDMSSMNLEATLTSADGKFSSLPMKGDFMVMGLSFEGGELSLGGTGISMHSSMLKNEIEHSVSISGDLAGTAKMAR